MCHVGDGSDGTHRSSAVLPQGREFRRVQGTRTRSEVCAGRRCWVSSAQACRTCHCTLEQSLEHSSLPCLAGANCRQQGPGTHNHHRRTARMACVPSEVMTYLCMHPCIHTCTFAHVCFLSCTSPSLYLLYLQHHKHAGASATLYVQHHKHSVPAPPELTHVYCKPPVSTTFYD